MAEEKREGTGRDPIDELVDEITGNVNWDDPKWQDTMPDWPEDAYPWEKEEQKTEPAEAEEAVPAAEGGDGASPEEIQPQEAVPAPKPQKRRRKNLPDNIAEAIIYAGGVLLISKFVIGAAIGIVVGKVFGPTGVLGLSSLAIISAVTNSNGSIYLALMNSYGDTVDQAAMPLLAINDGPMLTMIAMGIGGLADIPFMALVAAIGPILVGMILGNIDKDLSDFLAPAGTILLPFVGFCLGAGMNLTNIAKGGAQGILLGLVTCLIGGAFIVLCDRFISRRPGYAGWAVATTAGNAVAVPAVIAEADPSWAQWADVATSQVAASAILTAILVPIITSWWAKKFGCPKFPKDEAQKALFEKH